jgi:hypothetical protein
MPYAKGPFGLTTPRERMSRKLRDGAYRARKRGCPVELVTIADAEASGLLAASECYLCHKPIGEYDMYALEHKVSLFHRGPHSITNLGKSCLPCNQDKHIQDELDYLASLDLAS